MFLDELSKVLRLRIPADQIIKLARAETEKIILAEEELERQRIITLRTRFAGQMGWDLEKNLTSFTVEETIDLGIARKDVVIYERPFTSFTVTQQLPGAYTTLPHLWGNMRPFAYIRFNSISSPLYRVRYGEVHGNFNKIYLTNIAQSGYSFSFVIGTSKNASYGMKGDTTALLEGLNLLQGSVAKKNLNDLYEIIDQGAKSSVSTSITYNEDITDADTEYSQVIPIYTKNLKAVLADGAAFRLAWVTGKVAAPTAPYWTQPANIPFELSGLHLNADRTLYFAAGAGTKVMQIYIDR